MNINFATEKKQNKKRLVFVCKNNWLCYYYYKAHSFLDAPSLDYFFSASSFF